MNYTFQVTLSGTIYFDLIPSPLSPSFPFTHTETHKYTRTAICLYKSMVTKVTALVELLRIKKVYFGWMGVGGNFLWVGGGGWW